MPKRSKGFSGKDLLTALRNAGLKFGRFNVFHRPDRHNPGQSLFSVASLIEPGSFDLAQINDTKVPGISVFIILPGPEDSLMAFDNMLSTARELAQVLDADLFDERGSTLSVQRERYLREELIEYQHRQSRASALCG